MEKLIIIILIVTYLLALFIGFVDTYCDNKDTIKCGQYTVRQLLKDTHTFFYVPVLNVFVVVLSITIEVLAILTHVTKLDIVWERIMNIKIK
jgi:1,4-dihydroxy-2-naphthoate octaprenyltransferase